jgi:hypothetical protein
MSVDERLRSALRDQADAFGPQVEDALDRVRARGRFERWRGAAVAVAASAAAVAAIAGAVVALDGPRQEDAPPVEQPTASASGTATDGPQAPLRGTITADVDQPGALAGPWTLQLNGNGSIDASPPPEFGGEVSGPVFTADGNSFRTSLFGDDLCAGDGSGIYSWLRVGDRIEFTALSDTCADRARFFTDSTWTVSTGTAARD